MPVFLMQKICRQRGRFSLFSYHNIMIFIRIGNKKQARNEMKKLE